MDAIKYLSIGIFVLDVFFLGILISMCVAFRKNAQERLIRVLKQEGIFSEQVPLVDDQEKIEDKNDKDQIGPNNIQSFTQELLNNSIIDPQIQPKDVNSHKVYADQI